jgi:hypothetical protein
MIEKIEMAQCPQAIGQPQFRVNYHFGKRDQIHGSASHCRQHFRKIFSIAFPFASSSINLSR